MNKKIVIVFLVCLIVFVSLCIFLSKKNIPYDGIKSGSIPNYKNPPVPEGFSKVETESASWNEKDGIIDGWNNGLVIEDSDGNQFVWVPCSVEENNEVVLYSRYYDYGKFNNTIPVREDKIYHGSKESNIYYLEDDPINEDIKNNIVKYGGFYIGRYETGKRDEKTCIKQNVDLYNNITQSEAIAISKELEKSDSVKSYLMTSYCYDTTIKWMNNSDNNFFNNESKKNTYVDTEAVLNNINEITGSASEYDINNINNLFGNAVEWTTEKYNIKENKIYYVGRRGVGTKGSINSIREKMNLMDYSINQKYAMPEDYSGKNYGFRVVLVIMDI